MSAPAHTPGPWGRNIAPASRYPTIYAGRNKHVAQVVTSGLPESEAEANADLIAAAPKLLAALKAILACRNVCDGETIEITMPIDVWNDAVDAAVEAHGQ